MAIKRRVEELTKAVIPIYGSLLTALFSQGGLGTIPSFFWHALYLVGFVLYCVFKNRWISFSLEMVFFSNWSFLPYLQHQLAIGIQLSSLLGNPLNLSGAPPTLGSSQSTNRCPAPCITPRSTAYDKSICFQAVLSSHPALSLTTLSPKSVFMSVSPFAFSCIPSFRSKSF